MRFTSLSLKGRVAQTEAQTRNLGFEVGRLSNYANEKEPYSVTRAALGTLAAWDANIYLETFKRAAAQESPYGLAAKYREMAQDVDREREAEEWIEGLIGDGINQTR